MNLDRLSEIFAHAGFDRADAASRAVLLSRAGRAHEGRVGRPPDWAWFVPGRIEVFGKHTDYAGGRTLVAAVPRGFAVLAGAHAGHEVCVRDARTPHAGKLWPLSRSYRYVEAVRSRLMKNFPGAVFGADITILSDLPRAAGLSSSSALIVAVATTLIRRGALEAREEWRAAIHSIEDLSDYLGAVENGQTFRSLAGDSGVGTHGGSEDHTAIVTSRAGALTACRYAPLRPIGRVEFPADWRFIVASSGVAAQKTGDALPLYNRAASGARELVELWNTSGQSAQTTLGDLLESSPASAGHLHALVGRLSPERRLTLERRLAHFEAEDGRVPAAMSAFRDRDWRELGRLALSSQQDADGLLGNQTDETRRLASLAAGAGALAATSFGAGFGGSVWALSLRDEATVIGERWMRAYRAACPAVAAASEWFVAQPAPGLIELPIAP